MILKLLLNTLMVSVILIIINNKNIEKYSLNKGQKILILFDDIIAD